MAGNKKPSNSAKKSNGRKSENSETSDDDSIKIKKKHLYLAVGVIIVSVLTYQLELKYNFLKQTKNLVSSEEKSNPLKEPVDISKETPNYIKPFIEEEYHPNPNVRNLPSDLSKWPPGEMGKYLGTFEYISDIYFYRNYLLTHILEPNNSAGLIE